MKEILSVIATSKLFSGIDEKEIGDMLKCLDAKIADFKKGDLILRAGDITESVCLVIKGCVLVVQDDVWGNRNIISRSVDGQTFAAAYACSYGLPLNVNVYADTFVTIVFLNVKRILTICPSACSRHSRIIRNLLVELAEKNLRFAEKINHIGQRTTKAKLMSYFSAESQKNGRFEFDIPFSRQQLADYLTVERSGLSVELGKMRKEGLIDFHKNHFIIKI